MKRTAVRSFSLVALVVSLACAAAIAGNPLNLLPTPKVLKVDGGAMPLTAECRIVATEAKLKPLADILADEILLVTKLKPAVVEGDPRAGDIVLSINPKLQADADILTVHGQEALKTREYAHTIAVTDRAAIEGWDYRAVCEGTATLLQAIVLEGGKASVPRMTVKDWPYSDYNAIMPDCAREHQPIYVLKTVVETCRLFKVRYLHLHLSDDSAFTFPSTAYPEASSIHYPPVRPYTLEELRDLVAYADARGVTCVPEMEGPGHCTALMDGMKGKLGDVHWSAMDVLNPDIYPVLDTLVGEMCEVFKSSPYFHIGGDEVEPSRYLGQPHVKKYMQEHNVTDKHDVWLAYGQNMARIVKKHGKKTMMWDGVPVGCPLDPSLANEIIVYTWLRRGRARMAQDRGFTTVTVPWGMPPFPEFSLFTCNGDILTRNDKVLGHCHPMWEMDSIALANSYLRGAPRRKERVWGPDNVIEEDFDRNRMPRQSERADRIVRPVKIKVDARILRDESGGMHSGYRFIDGSGTVTMTTDMPGGRIRYTMDGTSPTRESTLYEKAFPLTTAAGFAAAVFDEAGKQVGNVTLSDKYMPLAFEKSLTTGKPVETSARENKKDKPEYANDGWVDIGKYWGAKPAPQWWKVDLEKEYSLARVQVVPFFDGTRFYQYTIEVSADGKAWALVADASKNATPGAEKGYMHAFPPVKARNIKVNLLKNSDNPAVHLVEVRAWEAGK
ncbi:MAG: family 20 glycosylhydrolase [Planctomycetota bacterium]|nr:family 20 glycosylhydrolase [Planctomycetota bacterium]